MSELQIINSDSQEIDKKIIDHYKSIAPPETEIEKAMAMEQDSGVSVDIAELFPGGINRQISMGVKFGILDTNLISDGYHTFGELYEHRIELFITLCRIYNITKRFCSKVQYPVWKSKIHSDGSSFDGWFVLGINGQPDRQITYHLPMSKWDECFFAGTLDKAPEYDGHTSADVLERLKSL